MFQKNITTRAIALDKKKEPLRDTDRVTRPTWQGNGHRNGGSQGSCSSLKRVVEQTTTTSVELPWRSVPQFGFRDSIFSFSPRI